MRATEAIQSQHNPMLKEVRRAVAKGELTADGCCIADTPHLLEEAIRGGLEIPVVFTSEDSMGRLPAIPAGSRIVVLPNRLLTSIASTESPQGVVALVRVPQRSWEDLFRGTPLLAVLDAVQDPGNAGAIARTADAFGATGIVFLQGSASPWNPKTLRSSAGSLFRLPAMTGVTPFGFLEAVKNRGVRPIASVPRGGIPPESAPWREPVALLIGSEGRGLRRELEGAAQGVTIATTRVESLNAATAASILLYEAARQRRPG